MWCFPSLCDAPLFPSLNRRPSGVCVALFFRDAIVVPRVWGLTLFLSLIRRPSGVGGPPNPPADSPYCFLYSCLRPRSSRGAPTQPRRSPSIVMLPSWCGGYSFSVTQLASVGCGFNRRSPVWGGHPTHPRTHPTFRGSS